jgi:hypothetical protein
MIVTDEQIQKLQSLRAEAVLNQKMIFEHKQRIVELASNACVLIGINPHSECVDERYIAAIIKDVVRRGVDPVDAVSQILIAEANRQFAEAAAINDGAQS